jgi:hypothetical protein
MSTAVGRTGRGARRANDTTKGAADGAIIAAVIATHMRVKEGSDPKPIPIA